MKPTKFYGSNERDAFLKVKDALGPEAVILETRIVKKGGVMGVGSQNIVEITATKNPISESMLMPEKPKSKMLERAYGTQSSSAISEDFVEAPKSEMGRGDALRAQLNQDENALSSSMQKVVDKVQEVSPVNKERQERLENEMDQIKEMVSELVEHNKSKDVQELSGDLRALYESLLENDVSKDLAYGLVNKMKKDLPAEVVGTDIRDQLLESYFKRLIPEHGPLKLKEGRTSYIALIGATGVGKTTTIAKLAAIYKFQQNKKVGMITMDTYRIAAVEQLRKYSEILDAPLEVVHSPEELSLAIEKLSDRDLVLIDTAGRNQKNEAKRKELESFFRYSPIEEIYLVLSATSSEKNVMSNIDEFSHFPISSLIITKVDEAITHGGILSIVAKSQRSIAYVTTGQEVPQDIEISNSKKITEMVLGQVSYDI